MFVARTVGLLVATALAEIGRQAHEPWRPQQRLQGHTLDGAPHSLAARALILGRAGTGVTALAGRVTVPRAPSRS